MVRVILVFNITLLKNFYLNDMTNYHLLLIFPVKHFVSLFYLRTKAFISEHMFDIL